jgi:hypothetical protein
MTSDPNDDAVAAATRLLLKFNDAPRAGEWPRTPQIASMSAPAI